MENLIDRHQDDEQIKEGIQALNLLQEHPKFKIGEIISFWGGYNNDIRYKSFITGFGKDGEIYVLWDCYWFPIKDEPKRKIKQELY